MTPTLLDVATILGLPIIRVEATTTHDTPIPFLGFHFSKSTSNYGSFIARNIVALSKVSNA